MFPRILTLALVLCVFSATASFADTFAWSYTGEGVNASGTFTTDPISGGTYLITGITGQRNGEIITGLSIFGGADNLLFPVFAYFDILGVSYFADGVAYNLYGTGQFPGPGVGEVPIELHLEPDGQNINIELATLTVTRLGEVPEPSSVLLVSSGLAAAAALRRRRKIA